MCAVGAGRWEGAKKLLNLSEAIDQLVAVSSVCWNSHVLSRDDAHFLRRTLDFDVESQRKKIG